MFAFKGKMSKGSLMLLLLASNICFTIFSFAAETVEVPLNPPRELDGVTREAILNLRRQYINKISVLAPKDYQTNMDVFGQIQDRKPWWGLLGMCYYGPGGNSILGKSKESRFIVNPYLLIGVEELNAHIVRSVPMAPEEFYPTPARLMWKRDGSMGQVNYNITSYYQKTLDYAYSDTHSLYLSDYNARDFGFNYFEIDSAKSENITAAFDKIIPIIQFIHTGGSCGYPGGCNNKSPSQAELEIKWQKLPAKIYLKLWKNAPADATQKPDMDFIIELL
jgi:hypothetical protein